MKILATITNIISNYPNGDDMLTDKSKSGIIDVSNTNLPPCVREYLENPKRKQISFKLVENKHLEDE